MNKGKSERYIEVRGGTLYPIAAASQRVLRKLLSFIKCDGFTGCTFVPLRVFRYIFDSGDKKGHRCHCGNVGGVFSSAKVDTSSVVFIHLVGVNQQDISRLSVLIQLPTWRWTPR